MFSRGTGMSWNASLAVAVPRMPHFAMRGFDDLEAGHVGRDEERRDLRSRSLPGTGVRAMTVSTLGDAAVGDVALLAVEDEAVPSALGVAGRLHVGGVGAGFGLGQGERGQLAPADQIGQPRRFLLLGAEQQQGADADRVVGVDEDGRRAAAWPPITSMIGSSPAARSRGRRTRSAPSCRGRRARPGRR